MLTIIINNIEGGHNYKCSNKCDDDSIVVTFSWNTWLPITIHLHMCRALPSPQCCVKRILVLTIIITTFGGRHSYKCSDKCDDDCGCSLPRYLLLFQLLSFHPVPSYPFTLSSSYLVTPLLVTLSAVIILLFTLSSLSYLVTTLLVTLLTRY